MRTERIQLRMLMSSTTKSCQRAYSYDLQNIKLQKREERVGVTFYEVCIRSLFCMERPIISHELLVGTLTFQ